MEIPHDMTVMRMGERITVKVDFVKQIRRKPVKIG